MTTSGVWSLARTRLPAWTISAPVRPAIGARIVAYCSCTFAFSTAALLAPTTASSAAAVRARGIALLARADAALDEVVHSLRNDLRVGGLRRVAREVRFGLIQRRFERPVVEREQHLPGLHVVTLLEVDGLQLAGDLRAHGHGGKCLDRADDVHVERHILFDDLVDGDGNCGLRRACAGALRVARANRPGAPRFLSKQAEKQTMDWMHWGKLHFSDSGACIE